MRERERLLRPERDFLRREPERLFDLRDRERRDFLRWHLPSAPSTQGDFRCLRLERRERFLEPERLERLDFLTLQEVDNFFIKEFNFLEYLADCLARRLIDLDFDLDLRLTILF